MANVSHRANLNAAVFPMVSEYQGQTVIVREADNNYVPSVSSKADEDRDIGIPQIYYCHNVVPTQEGLASVGYRLEVNETLDVEDFSQIFILRDTLGNRVLFGITLGGAQYVVPDGDTNWYEIDPVAGSAGKLVTVTFVSGVTYIYFESIGCFTYDFVTNELVPQVLTGLDTATILGVIGNSGYLISWSVDGIAWSSTVDPTDFVPSLATGAGGGGVEGARGAITVLVPTVAGFVVYTTNNAVAASYSGNARFPFNFREIVGAGGLLDVELAGADGNSGVQYAYTTFGLQSVTFQQAVATLPQVTDFISGSVFEDFNELTKEFTLTRLTGTMKKKLTVVAGRYLILSYGVNSLTHALYYDLALKRFGKLKINHIDCFDFSSFEVEGVETAKRSIGFLQADGSLFTLDSDYLSAVSYGVLITGKYQLRRNRLLQMNRVVLENIRAGGIFSLTDLYAPDGKNNLEAVGFLLADGTTQREYAFDTVGLNHSLLFTGNFALNTIVLHFNIHGRVM